MLLGAELGLIAPQLEQPLPPAEPERDGDPHLRSCGEVTGYYVAATDGDVCHVEDFLFDDETWAIRYLVVATPQLVAGQEGARLRRGGSSGSTEYEDALRRHYRKPSYWSICDEPVTPLSRE